MWEVQQKKEFVNKCTAEYKLIGGIHMKCAIYGAGSLGTILGAYLTKGGIDIDLINHNNNHVEAMRQKGAIVTGTMQMTVPVKAIYPQEMTKKYDLIFLMTKQTENRKIVEFLKDYLNAGGILCTMQNGFPEPMIAEILGEDSVMGSVVEWGATLLGPGVSELTSEPESLSFSLGSLTKRRDNKLAEVKRILEKMGTVTIEDNLIGSRFSKLLINASFSGLSAVTGLTFGEAAKNKASRVWIQLVMKECMDVATKVGVTMEPIQGKDIVKLMNYNNKWKKRFAFLLIPFAIKKHAKLKASMLQDLEKGRKTEVDYINGIICEYGRKYHVPTPYNSKIVEMIHEIEESKRSCGLENVKIIMGD
jgi:2-dehydropantoate 2-reductase